MSCYTSWDVSQVQSGLGAVPCDVSAFLARSSSVGDIAPNHVSIAYSLFAIYDDHEWTETGAREHKGYQSSFTRQSRSTHAAFADITIPYIILRLWHLFSPAICVNALPVWQLLQDR